MIKDGQVYVECPTCEGEGVIDYRRPQVPTVKGKCPRCNGSGYVKAATPAPPPYEQGNPTAALYVKPITGKDGQEFDARLKWDGGQIGNRVEVTLGTFKDETAAAGLLQIFARTVKGIE